MAARQVQQALGVSQPTMSRLLAPLLRAGEIVATGAARARHYLLPRAVPDVGWELPIVRVDAAGQTAAFGRLVPLQGGGVWLEEADGPSRRYDTLPWFLEDMRPQGFMGRAFARAHPGVRLGADPRHWSDDDVLRALALAGDDLPGNLIVGRAAFDAFAHGQRAAAPAVSTGDYAALADRAMQGTLPGSSAGGEQPKFCTVVDGRPVLVKFSPPGDSPVDQRQRDLLVCEHLALQTLADAGIAAARTRIVEGAGRVFLEAERFDRTSAGGRIGMVSLLAYDAEHVGRMDNWAATADRMATRGLLARQDAVHLQLLEAYGRLIANTDRHYGNISLLRQDGRWVLAPAYDMLPMLHAPVAGELVERQIPAEARAPTADVREVWAQAQTLAARFWDCAAEDIRISAGFRAICAGHRALC